MVLKTAVLVAVSMVALLAAQSRPLSSEQSTTQESSISNSVENLSLEPLGPGDLIQVYVENYQAITRSYRVSSEGTIELPTLKQPIYVNGLRVEDVAKALSAALCSNKLLVEPVVSVTVIEYRSRPVNVVGAVRQPLTLQATGDLRLLDAISKANGLSPEAGPEIIVTRPEMAGVSGYTRHISVKDLMESSNSWLNISLQGGEEIRVPIADKVYIAGNVKMPGAYPLDQAGGLTVIQALALCQGTLSFTQPIAVIYRPTRGTQKRAEINIPLRDIMKRQAPDVALLPDDILYVLDNSGKRTTATVLDRIASFGAATGSGLIIWGNR